MQRTAGGGGRWLHIVLGPVDPSQSERSCLSSSALDSRGTLILPDSRPREMMGRETAHSTHVTRRAGGRSAVRWGWEGGVGRDVKTGRQRGWCALAIAEAETVALSGTAWARCTTPWHTHTHKNLTHTNTDRQTHTHTHTHTHSETRRRPRLLWYFIRLNGGEMILSMPGSRPLGSCHCL